MNVSSENNKIKKTTTQWPESFSELNRVNKSPNYAGKKGRYHLPASKYRFFAGI